MNNKMGQGSPSPSIDGACESLDSLTLNEARSFDSFGQVVSDQRDHTERDKILKTLRECYETANRRASALATPLPGAKSGVKKNRKNGVSTYTALSALLYTSIGISKIDDLETYVKTRGSDLPTDLFDWNEWEQVVMQAKRLRRSESEVLASENGTSLFPTVTVADDISVPRGQHIPKKECCKILNELNFQVWKLKRDIREYKASSVDEIQRFYDSSVKISTAMRSVVAENEKLKKRIDEILEENVRLHENLDTIRTCSNEGSSVTHIEEELKSLKRKFQEEVSKRDQIIFNNSLTIEKLKSVSVEHDEGMLSAFQSSVPETLDPLSQQASLLVGSSISMTVKKLASEKLMNHVGSDPIEDIRRLSKNLEETRQRNIHLVQKLKEISKSSIPWGAKCNLTFTSNNQSEDREVYKILLTCTDGSDVPTQNEVSVDAEVFREAYETALANDYVLDLCADRDKEEVQSLLESNRHLSKRVADLEDRLRNVASNEKDVHTIASPEQNKATKLRSEAAAAAAFTHEITSLKDEISRLQLKLDETCSAGTTNTSDKLIESLRNKLNNLQQENRDMKKKLNPDYIIPSLDTEEGRIQVALLVQRVVRGFLGRSRVAKLLTQRTENAFIACAGTRQGRTGWYCKDGVSYFYFCIVAGKFLPLVGPISKEVYDVAKATALGETKGCKRLVHVDSSSIYAVKAQMEILLQDLMSVRKGRSKSVSVTAEAVIGDLDKKLDNVTKNLEDYKLENQMLKLHVRRDSSSGSPRSSKARNRSIVLLQVRVRMFLARLRVGRIRLSKFSEDDSRYTALPYYTQGESGWYIKGGQYYYMISRRVREVNGNKIYTKKLDELVGPVTVEAYQEILDNTKLIYSHRYRSNVDCTCVVALKRQLKRLSETRNVLDDVLDEVSIDVVKNKTSEDIQGVMSTERSSPVQHRRISVIQGLFRRASAKRELQTRRNAALASQYGILLATDTARQGEMGWYIAPDGSHYYFVIVEGRWIPVCGPLSQDAYESMAKFHRILSMKREAVDSRISCQSTTTQLISAPSDLTTMVKIGMQEENSEANPDLDGMIYLNARTNDIYIAYPLERTYGVAGKKCVLYTN